MPRIKAITEGKRLFHLGIPLIISQVALIGMSVTDTFMAGQYGTDDLAGIAVAAGLWHPLLVLLLGVLAGVSPFMAQAFGASDWRLLGRKLIQGCWLGIFSSVIIIAMIFWVLPQLFDFSEAPEVDRVADGYLFAIAFGVPGLAFATVLRCFCEANGHTKAPMIVNVLAFFANIVLDYVLVFGIGDSEGFGGIGCGIATASIYWLTGIGLLVHLRFSKSYNHIWATLKVEGPHRQTIYDIVKVGLPSSIGFCAEVSFFAVVAILLVPFGSDTVAAHQIALNMASMIFMIPYGMSMAICIRVGHLIGQGDLDQARYASFLTIAISCSIAVLTATATLLFKDGIVELYTSDPTVLTIARNLLFFSAAFQIIDAVQIISVGALRGYKDTRIPMVIQILSYWGVGFTVSWSLSLGNITGTSWEASGFWMGFVAGLIAAGLLLIARLNRVSKKYRVRGTEYYQG